MTISHLVSENSTSPPRVFSAAETSAPPPRSSFLHNGALCALCVRTEAWRERMCEVVDMHLWAQFRRSVWIIHTEGGGRKRGRQKNKKKTLRCRNNSARGRIQQRLFLHGAEPHSLYFRRRSRQARWRRATTEVLADVEPVGWSCSFSSSLPSVICCCCCCWCVDSNTLRLPSSQAKS